MKTHTHKGMVRSNGNLRSHPVSQKHKDKNVQKYHNLEVNKNKKTSTQKKIIGTEMGRSNKPKVIKGIQETSIKTKHIFKRDIVIPVDQDGFAHLDLSTLSCNVKGLRVKFVRVEGRKKRTVGLQINK